MEFSLRKAGHPNRQVRQVPDGTVAEFPIPSVGREDGGSYTCDYRSITQQSHWSYLSDPVEIIVAGCWLAGHSGVWGQPSYPKPNISLLSPSGGVSLGGAVTILCCGQDEGLQFVLNKEGRNVQWVNSDYLALFHINNVRREHGGIYSCSYHNQSQPSAVSYPSDPMELVVRGRPDFTNTNITRLVLGAMVLLVLGLILAEAYYSRPRGGALGAWIPPSGEENLPREQAASPQGAETPAQPPLLPNTPAPENPPQQLPI
ncbi:immunoglobulin superfamily member 1-like [Mauremys mutica]|uniref:immunoglobulin superfamily member 1-like n=1 Tax=Mauremys mutica TaxID=74926 RepID=UPI001D162763|nr:immunoglobulin superfamily member 1-like [Mauremys mutica]